LNRIRNDHERRNNGVPKVNNKEDIFNIERDSLSLQVNLSKIDVNVIVVAWQKQRTVDKFDIRAQYATKTLPVRNILHPLEVWEAEPHFKCPLWSFCSSQ